MNSQESNKSNAAQSPSNRLSGKLPRKSGTVTLVQEYGGSYEKRAKGATPHEEIILHYLESFCYPCKSSGGFVMHTRRGTSKYRPGDLVGNIHKDSERKYRRIYIKGKHYAEHRLMWLWFYGYFPKNTIDHISGDTLDNSIENLRDVDIGINLRNTKGYSNSSTGVHGVHKSGKGFIAELRYNGKLHYGGYYLSVDAAANAVQALKDKLNSQGAEFTERHGEYHGYSE